MIVVVDPLGCIHRPLVEHVGGVEGMEALLSVLVQTVHHLHPHRLCTGTYTETRGKGGSGKENPKIV